MSKQWHITWGCLVTITACNLLVLDDPTEIIETSGGGSGAGTGGGTAGTTQVGGAGGGLLMNGASCGDGVQCQSTFCADGVCCDSVCGGSCESCAAASTNGVNGVCTAIPSGFDPDAECLQAEQRCDGAGSCIRGATIWATSLEADRIDAIAVAGDDSIIVAGVFIGTMECDGSKTSAAMTEDAFVAKLDPVTGAVVWCTQLGGFGDQRIGGATIVTSGNIEVGGSYDTALNVGATTLFTGGTDRNLFRLQLTAAGGDIVAQSEHSYGDTTDQVGGAVVATDNGDVMFTAKSAGGSLDFGCGALTTVDGAVARLTDSGGCAWQVSMTGTDVGPPSVAVSNGRVALMGRFQTMVALSTGGTVLGDANGGKHIYAMTLMSNGQALWPAAMRFVDSLDPMVMPAVFVNRVELAVDPVTSQILFAGDFREGAVTIDGNTVQNTASTNDMYVGAFNDIATPSGMGQVVQFNSSNTDTPRAIAARDDRLAVGGSHKGTVQSGWTSACAIADAGANASDAVVMVMRTADLSCVWAHAYGNTFDQRIETIGIDSNNNVIVTGASAGDDLDLGQTHQISGQRVFVAKLSP